MVQKSYSINASREWCEKKNSGDWLPYGVLSRVLFEDRDAKECHHGPCETVEIRTGWKAFRNGRLQIETIKRGIFLLKKKFWEKSRMILFSKVCYFLIVCRF